MKKTILLILAVLMLGVMGCEKQPDMMVDNPQSTGIHSLGKMVDGICYPDTTTLWAGQTTNAGNLIVWNDAQNLYVKYELTSGTFGTLHLWVCDDLTLLPTSNKPGETGAPVPGQFDKSAYGYSFDATGLSSYTFTIPLTNVFATAVTDPCGKQVYVFAHAEWGGETIWGGNQSLPISRWNFYYQYAICCGQEPPVITYINQTAFAKPSKTQGGYVFTTDAKSNPEKYPSLNLTRNRWGWAANYSYQLNTEYSYPIYAGAGLNKISNGVLVGTLKVKWNGSDFVVTYDIDAPFKLVEVHVYLSADSPTTLAPGQYGYIDSFDPLQEDCTVTLPSSVGNVWLIAHAVVAFPTVQ